MTDDEIREALRLDFERTSPTRSAPKLPSTQRTVETWRRLHHSTNWPHGRDRRPDLLAASARPRIWRGVALRRGGRRASTEFPRIWREIRSVQMIANYSMLVTYVVAECNGFELRCTS